MSGLPESEFRAILQSVLLGVCTSCDFVHGEALKPSHSSSCLVQVRFEILHSSTLHPISKGSCGHVGGLQQYCMGDLSIARTNQSMCPPDPCRPLQTGASHSSTAGGHDFHRASMNFYIPPNVSLDGRVWKTGCIEVRLNTHAARPWGGLVRASRVSTPRKTPGPKHMEPRPQNWRRLLTGD